MYAFPSHSQVVIITVMLIIGSITYLFVFGGLFLFFWTTAIWWAWKVLNSLYNLLLHPLLTIFGMTDGGEDRALGKAVTLVKQVSNSAPSGSGPTGMWNRGTKGPADSVKATVAATPKAVQTPVGKASHKDRITQVIEEVSSFVCTL